MDISEAAVKKVVDMIEYERRCRELRAEFLQKGVRFYEKKGWGFIKNGIKHFEEYYSYDT
jgi:hypothetical protein